MIYRTEAAPDSRVRRIPDLPDVERILKTRDLGSLACRRLAGRCRGLLRARGARVRDGGRLEMNGVRLFWNDAEKPGNRGSADQRMSCARPWTYSISSLGSLTFGVGGKGNHRVAAASLDRLDRRRRGVCMRGSEHFSHEATHHGELSNSRTLGLIRRVLRSSLARIVLRLSSLSRMVFFSILPNTLRKRASSFLPHMNANGRS